MLTRREFLQATAVSGTSVTGAGRVIGAGTVIGATAGTAHPADRKEPARLEDGRKSKDGLVRLAMVGVGDISPRYLKQAAQSSRARFVATCARTLDEAKARAVEYGIGAWYDDYAAMYDAVKPDGVVIATPNSLHAIQSIDALKRGIAVLCDKPMATTWEDCQAMVAAAEKHKALLLALPFSAGPMYTAALDHLNEATLGVFTGAEAQILFPPTMFKLNDWHYNREMSGGWTLNALVYPVAQLISLLGPAQRVTGFINTLVPHRTGRQGAPMESDIDDNASLVLEWRGGQQAIVRVLDSTSFYRQDSAIYGRRGTMWLSGGNLVIHSPDKPLEGAQPVEWNGQKNCYRVAVKPAKNEGLIEHFVDCIQGIVQPVCSAQQQLHVHEILFKGHEAARTRQAQELRTTFTPWRRIDPSFHDARSRRI